MENAMGGAETYKVGQDHPKLSRLTGVRTMAESSPCLRIQTCKKKVFDLA